MGAWLDRQHWVSLLITAGELLVAGLVVTWVARRLIGRFERHVAGALATDSTRGKRAKTLAALLRASATVVIWTVVLITLLEQAGVPVGPLLAAAGIGGIALGFGAQHLVRDLVAGFCILLENQYDVGDEVKVGDVEGTVESLSLRTTVLRGVDGARHVVANGEIRVSSNRTRLYSRDLLVLPLRYDADIDRAVELARATSREMREDPAFATDMLGDVTVLGVDAFAERGVEVKLYVQTRPGRQHAVGRELRRRIKLALDEAGVPMAMFPDESP